MKTGLIKATLQPPLTEIHCSSTIPLPQTRGNCATEEIGHLNSYQQNENRQCTQGWLHSQILLDRTVTRATNMKKQTLMGQTPGGDLTSLQTCSQCQIYPELLWINIVWLSRFQCWRKIWITLAYQDEAETSRLSGMFPPCFNFTLTLLTECW